MQATKLTEIQIIILKMCCFFLVHLCLKNGKQQCFCTFVFFCDSAALCLRGFVAPFLLFTTAGRSSDGFKSDHVFDQVTSFNLFVGFYFFGL